MRNIQKTRGGIVSDIVNGTAGLIIGVIIAFVIIAAITGAGLLTSGSAEDNATDHMVGNFTAGIDNVSTKLPTVLLVAAIVLLFGVLVVLVAQYKRMQLGGGGSL